MSLLHNLAAGLRTLLRKKRTEAEMSDELQTYLDAAVQDKVRSGMNPEDAWRAARIEMGSMEAVKEGIRSQGWESRIEALFQDLRYGLRQLRRSPGFTAAALLTLALGIGANTAVFSVIDAALLRPLPYDRPEQLVSLSMMHLNGNPTVIAPDFKVWQAQSAVFDSIGAFGLGWNRYSSGANLTGTSEAAHVHVHSLTPDFFPMLGVRAILGRGFRKDEAQVGHNQVALLSAATWRRNFGADSSVINRTIHLDGMPYTVVGVMPPGLLYPPGDLWVPLILDASNSLPQSADWLMLDVIGRLKPGVSVAKARADLEVLTHRLDAQFASGRRKGRSRWHVEVIPLRQVLAADSGPLLFILLGAVGFVLLIACANLANLLLARAAARSREIAVRAALGAGRSRLIRQLLAESGLLAASGGGIGCTVGLWGERVLKQLIPPELPADGGLDLRILAFVIGISACAVLLFGVLPALLTSRVDVVEALKEGGERAGSGRGTARLRGLLVVTEMALALVLLTGAGLLAQSVLRLTGVDLGFDPHHLLLGEAYLPVTLVDQPQRQSNFFHEALERLQGLPGVETAAVTTHYPVSVFNGLASGVQVLGGPPPEPNQAVSIASISPDFFKTIGIPIRQGRFFNAEDTSAGRKVVILNEAEARRLVTGQSPVGREISFDGTKGPWREVVGVVADTRNYSLEREPWPEIYIPYEQNPSLVMFFVLRTTGDPMSFAKALRRAVAAVDSDVPVTRMATMDEVVEELVAPRRFRLILLGSFAALAVLLAALGLYGVISYAITQRTREIGVRIALGADRRDVLKLVLRQGLKLVLLGIGIGTLGSLALTRYLVSLLYGITSTDPLTFSVVALILVVVALVATLIPARRAMRVDPIVALRYE